MTRKYIEALVDAIRRSREASALYKDRPAVDRTALYIAQAIESLMPGFDTVRFLRDCGVTP